MLLPIVSHFMAGSEGVLAWLIDLGSHWQCLYSLGLLVFVALASWLDRRWAVLFLALPLPWLTASPAAPMLPKERVSLTVASANVHIDNQNTQLLRQWLAQAQPDVVVLLEVSPEYIAGLAPLRAYPHRKVLDKDGLFSIALLSRLPLADVEVQHDPEGIPRLAVQVELSDQRVRILAEHPMPPISAGYHHVRNAKFAARAAEARVSGLPTVLVGDLNASPWSSAFGGLAANGLRRATGFVPTWPAVGRVFPGIPIDHVLVSAHWSVVSQARGPDLGSDHYPVVVELALR